MQLITFRRVMPVATAVLMAMLALILLLSLLFLAGNGFSGGPFAARPAYAAGGIHCVDDDGGATNAPCTNATAYTNTQAAVDAATEGDEIRVASGVYTDVYTRPRNDFWAIGVVTQVVYISQTVTLRGGYTPTNWTTPYPFTQPTTLDAQGEGRVFYITGDINPTIEGLRIINGDAAGLGGGNEGGKFDAGGGLYLYQSVITLSGNTVLSNTAAEGGGLYFQNSSGAVLTANIISENVATWGGGLYFRDSPSATLTANTVSENKWPEPDGRAISGGGVQFRASPGAILTANTVSENVAIDGGGLFFLNSSDATLTRNIITSNYTNRGGGLRFRLSDNVTLTDNTVISNIADIFGGGLYLENSAVTMTNNVIADNQANVAGSGLYITDSSPRLLHTTIARNSGDDSSGVYITGITSTAALTNTILVSHSVGITVTAGNTATLNGVLWYSNTTNTGGDGTIIVTNQYTGHPAFTDDGYHLTVDSAAIDKEVNAGVKTDIDGDPRPIGTGYDIGADEFPAALTVIKQADPDPVQAEALLTYTLRVTNTGNVTLTATITDALPNHATPAGVLSWTPTITAPGGVWVKQVVVTVGMCYSGTLTNVVQVTTEEGATGIYTETSAVVTEYYCVYLPVILK